MKIRAASSGMTMRAVLVIVPLVVVLVVVINGALLATGVISPAVALALFLAVEVPLGATVVIGYVRRFRTHRAEAGNRRGAWRALAAEDPYLRLFTAEVHTLASLGRWVARKPDVPAGAVAIGYSRGTLGIPIAMVVVALIETVAIHFWVPWPTVRLVLDLLGVYALIVMLGWLAGRIVRPHLIVHGQAGGGELVLRSGLAVCARVPLNAVAGVSRDRRLSPTNGEISVSGDAAVLALPGPDGTSLTIELTRPVAATVPAFPWSRPEPQEVTLLRLHVDDPDEAARLIHEAVSAIAERTGS